MFVYTLITWHQGAFRDKTGDMGKPSHTVPWTETDMAQSCSRDLYMALAVIARLLPEQYSTRFRFFTRTFPHDRLRVEMGLERFNVEAPSMQGATEAAQKQYINGAGLFDPSDPLSQTVGAGIPKLKKLLTDDKFLEKHCPLLVVYDPTSTTTSGDGVRGPKVYVDTRHHAFSKFYKLLMELRTIVGQEDSDVGALVQSSYEFCQHILTGLSPDGAFVPGTPPAFQPRPRDESFKTVCREYHNFVMKQVDYHLRRENRSFRAPGVGKGRTGVTNTVQGLHRKRRSNNGHSGNANRVGTGIGYRKVDADVLRNGLSGSKKLPAAKTAGKFA